MQFSAHTTLTHHVAGLRPATAPAPWSHAPQRTHRRATQQHSTSTDTGLPAASSPHLDYLARLRARESDPTALPLLLLAPMENLADRPFRVAHVATIGGMDEACMEFMRVPNKSERPMASVRGACAGYNAAELSDHGVPLAAQVMGSNPEILGLAALHLARDKHAPRVDLNCGCPANTVTGNGAGSSLLKNPELVHKCIKAMVDAAGSQTLVTVKMRAGYQDTSLFEENLLAAQEAGARFLMLHARTKAQAYSGRANWELIARARQLLTIPVIGNGDVVSVGAARQLLESGCQGVCIGRGAVQDPLLFHRIRASFTHPDLPWEWNEPDTVQAFLRVYAQEAFTTRSRSHTATFQSAAAESSPQNGSDGELGCGGVTERSKFGRLKKVMKYLFNSSPALAAACDHLLRLEPRQGMTAEELVEVCCQHVQQHWPSTGPSRLALFNHMTKQAAERVTVLTEV